MKPNTTKGSILIPGKMNVLYTICKPGYAKGAEVIKLRHKPKRKKPNGTPFNPAYILRKAA